MRKATITGLGKYLPEKVMTNKDLEKIVDTDDGWIKARTGIEERRIAADDETASDLGVKAAEEALKKAGIKAEELDLIIVATITPDMPFPATACLIQDRIGASNAGAFDLEAACSGFVYGISVASSFIESGMYDNIMVIGTEVLSKIINWEDRGTCILFGDGAGAAVLQPTDKGGILASDLGSDGSGGDTLYMPGGGSLKPATHETVDNKEHYLYMEGNQVFKFAVKIMSKASLKVLKKAGLSTDDVDLLIPHQANTRIIASSTKRLKLKPEQVFVNLDKYGNTSAASVPIALAEAEEQGLIKNGDTIVLVAFGGGLTWASTVLEWNDLK
ncbi:beta-ketoacyl-ACP synthase III [Halanaerobium hydrogeniformans]|uniref:Beta-ketoacyl-[acyl-carrier-protein] synthase III n=1 Tax=Halanaerobium hydrogeniformans TaxID=656519 RepID=E4RMK6_HALHG|nr:beta-ketoacyl-ACP synthase III [Halanaerobium hydrogeniformans]ADQ14537.1 3-oxoacyl-(acyl-carrier-protein) synthase III [Halanaerobium hydrogeniformans]